MELDNTFNQIQVTFQNRNTIIDLSDTFYQISNNEIGIKPTPYRELQVKKLSLTDYYQLIKGFKLAIQKSDELVIDFFKSRENEIEPLYSMEFDHFQVELDLLSYRFNKRNNKQPIFELDVLMDCMDAYNNHIFMHDSRGMCGISFEMNSKGILKVTEIS